MRLIALAFLVACAFAASGQLSNDECLGCHGDPSAGRVHVSLETFNASVHAPLGCTDCHASVRDYPHEGAASAGCSSCHADAVDRYTASAHARARSRGDKVAAVCIDCHGKHDILPKSDRRSRVNRFNVPQTCASCHADAAVTKSHPMPPPGAIRKYFQGVHGEGTLEKGLNVSAVCSDCHGAHAVLPKADPASTISHDNVPPTCGRCHEGILAQWQQSAHGQLWSKKDRSGPVCTSCHEAHGIRHTDAAPFRLGMAGECSDCHAAEAPTYRDSFHGQATELGFSPAAKCSDCHTPHLNLPKSDPRSSIHAGNLQKTCGSCHPGATANFASFQPHADPHDRETSPQVYYVYNYLMKWLLAGVFAFFGIHTLLWMQRSIVAAIRGELPRHHAQSGRWVLRFRKKHRLTHIAVVVSFLALAATGLPLMYSHQPWGRTLASWLGGVGTSTAIHRLFALVTFGYALHHLFFVVLRTRTWFGPDSMVPRVRDLIDLKNMLKWFLYLGPRPRFDRYTYWEKFDYFAVFWGVPVIGLSGLMLWVPELVTRFLPGWALNVAMLVHGDEALLAIGFIFTFHFFHTHLRPEAFPLDQVMFTGRMPLERFQEERPDEYARLVEEGRLGDFLTSAPTVAQITFARVFGFITLGIGVLLIVAIYVTVFTQITH